MKNTLKILGLLLIMNIFQHCRPVDLRTTALKSKSIENPEQQGRALLQAAKIAMGYDQLAQTKVYEAGAKFNWNSMWLVMPMNSFPGTNKKDLQLRLATNSFDGQVEYLEGRKENTIMGLQSWEGYKTAFNSTDHEQHDRERYKWGLATYHYLIEAPMHLTTAEIVRYAGTKELDGIEYDIVYVT